MLEFRMSSAPELTARDLQIMLYCKTGGRAALAAATLLDMGDGVLCCEFHTKMNAIGADMPREIREAVRWAEADDEVHVVTALQVRQQRLEHVAARRTDDVGDEQDLGHGRFLPWAGFTWRSPPRASRGSR